MLLLETILKSNILQYFVNPTIFGNFLASKFLGSESSYIDSVYCCIQPITLPVLHSPYRS